MFDWYFQELIEILERLDRREESHKSVNHKNEKNTLEVLEDLEEILSQIRVTVHSVKNPVEKENFTKLSQIAWNRLGLERSVLRIQSSNYRGSESLRERLLQRVQSEILECKCECEKSIASVVILIKESTERGGRSEKKWFQ